MHYLLSMSYLRYTAAPDLPRAEHHIVQAAADLLWSRPIKEYPDLKIALSEGGTGEHDGGEDRDPEGDGTPGRWGYL